MYEDARRMYRTAVLWVELSQSGKDTDCGGEVAREGTRAREGGCERIVVMAVTVCANAQQTKCGGRSV
jgi:hypothetical protein